GYESFAIPPDVGGRFSVLTPVGLLPIAVGGLPVEELVGGAAAVMRAAGPDPHYPPYRYAAARTALHRAGKRIEVLATGSVRLAGVCEWWKQLFGESEGKEGRGLFPASVQYTTDLHSLGQWLQEGPREVMETFLEVAEPAADPEIPAGDDGDGLGYLAGRPLSEVNRAALEATRFAHLEGGVPNLSIRLGRRDARHLGALYAFFERAVALSGYLLGVDPFTQPGVEQYKRAMFALLGRPGAAFASPERWQAYRARPAATLELPVE
ncbi:MAG: glucose-6-phosphate isomerase, partial [Nitrospirae bacterium]